MKKHPTIATTGLSQTGFRHTITLGLFALLTAGMAACNGANSSDPAANQGAEAINVSNSERASYTPAQKAAWKQKREAVRKQVEAVLTPAQTQQLETQLQQGEKMRRAVSSLDLKPDQKTKIDTIFKTAYAHRDQAANSATAPGTPQ